VRPIILAEDNDKLRRLYSDALEAVGFNVMRAGDGEKAISLLHKIVNPQLIILDVMMPRMDGIEACILMRKMQGLRPCPILFLTALDDPENLLECLRAGGDDFLMKSAPLAEMLERVQYWVRHGTSEESTARRQAAINVLESVPAEAEAGDRGRCQTAAEVLADQVAMDRLAAYLCRKEALFNDGDEMLYRFGYMVGLVETCSPSVGKSVEGFRRFLRNLAFRTEAVDRKEIDALLDNYARLLNQSRFQEGWRRACDDAPDVGMPEPSGLQGCFAELPANE
jgi:DNA-binding response OmpR family regulator